jgi:hypothetical protein
MIEGSGAGYGSIPLTSGSGPERPKNMWIRIRNTSNWDLSVAAKWSQNVLFVPRSVDALQGILTVIPMQVSTIGIYRKFSDFQFFTFFVQIVGMEVVRCKCRFLVKTSE